MPPPMVPEPTTAPERTGRACVPRRQIRHWRVARSAKTACQRLGFDRRLRLVDELRLVHESLVEAEACRGV